MALNIPTIKTYGHYSSSNWSGHCRQVDFPAVITLWYSYDTVVAFITPDMQRLLVRQNDWGPTTGKHLNWIDGGDHDGRLPGKEFEALLKEYAAGCSPATAPDPSCVQRLKSRARTLLARKVEALEESE